MSDERDDYLWTGVGPVSRELAGIERELRSLAWQPRELSLPEAAQPIELRRRADDEGHRAREWLPLVAGLAAAAVVLALLAGLRGRGDELRGPSDAPAQPSGKPSPELRDPFSGDAPQLPTPSTEPPALVDPFANESQPAQHSSDLKDPFASDDEQHEQAPPAPRPRSRTTKQGLNPDLKDPFKDSPSERREPGKLYDPFSGEQREPQNGSPDLKDPFRR
jgi:hypothetical protein